MKFNYLPELSKDAIEHMVYQKDSTFVDDELKQQTFERIGLDRLFMILKDIYVNYGKCWNFSFLDVGCNNGLFSNFISSFGNKVVGIDNYAINSQGRYDDLEFSDTNLAELRQIDIEELLQESNCVFDFSLLLSVTHQWEYGYAHTGGLVKSEETIRYIMNALLNRTQKAIYYECPIEEPGFESNYGISFLKRTIEQYENLSIVKLADTIASNGYMRALYRISRIQSENDMCRDSSFYSKVVAFKNSNRIEGKVVSNAVDYKDKFLICDERNRIIYIPIEGKLRTMEHPMGEQPCVGNKNELWKKIKEIDSRYIEKIYAIYEEGFAEVEIVQGVPGTILNSMPTWHRKMMCKQGVAYDVTYQTIAELAKGLGDLHESNIAHGDPYPYNAIIGAGDAKWIDLGNATIGDEEIKKDIVVFFLYVFPHMVKNIGEISYKKLRETCKLFKEHWSCRTVMHDVARVLETDYGDSKKIDPKDIPIVFEFIGEIVDICNSDQNKYQVYYQAYKYETDTIVWMNNADMYSMMVYFDELIQKYVSLENQRLRLSKDELLGEIRIENESLKKRIDQLNMELNSYKRFLQALR